MSVDSRLSSGSAGKSEARVALVTGAGSGVGRAVSLRLARDGAVVVVLDLDAAAAEETAQLVKAESGRATVRAVDLADRRQRDGVVDSVLAELGRLDVLVNNAAYTGRRRSFLDMEYDEWDRILETNLGATAFLCREAGKHMAVRGSGAIVNVISIQHRLPVATYAPYVASKGAIAALTRALAVELSPSGVRVNSVELGVIATSSYRKTLESAGQRGNRKVPVTATLLGRDGSPDEAAAAIAFLASADASFITGAVLTVDGGRSLSRRPDPFETAFGVHSVSGRV